MGDVVPGPRACLEILDVEPNLCHVGWFSQGAEDDTLGQEEALITVLPLQKDHLA